METQRNLTQSKIKGGIIALLACCLTAGVAAGARAQNAKINLDFLNELASKASKVTNVNLDGPMLEAATRNERSSTQKPEAQQQMLQRLKGVYVRSFEFEKPGEYSHADVEKVLKQLRAGGWSNVVNVEKKAEGETTEVYVMNERGETLGMTVVAAKPRKLTVVNLVGPVDFDQLSDLDQVFNSVGIQRAQTRPKAAATTSH